MILSTLPAIAGEKPSLFDRLIGIDSAFSDSAQIATARAAFDALDSASCGEPTARDPASCLITMLFASDTQVVAEPGDPDSSTITSALASHRGNCAAFTALVLAVADRVHVPLEAVVFPRHVVVREPGSDHAFELLDHGFPMTMAQIRKRQGGDGAHETVVQPRDFPAYYLDNLAVRFAEAGNADRGEALFKQAIDAGPYVARIRFNYGTFLLGRDQLERAQDQLHRAVRLDSNNASAWANLGVAYVKVGNSKKGRSCFERALHVEPKNRIASENLKALNAAVAHQR